MARYRIGQAAAMSGINQANIRFYEAKKLLSVQTRSASSYRLYSDRDIHTLRFIRHCRSLDMSLEEVAALLGLGLTSRADCALAEKTLDSHLDHVRTRLRELRALEGELLALRECCDGASDVCHIVEALHRRADSVGTVPVAGHASRHV